MLQIGTLFPKFLKTPHKFKQLFFGTLTVRTLFGKFLLGKFLLSPDRGKFHTNI